jgi:thiaminase
MVMFICVRLLNTIFLEDKKMKINELIKDAIEECRSSKVIQAMQTTKIKPEQFLFYHRQDALLFGNF